MITYTILGVPYYYYSTIYPKGPVLIIKAPTLGVEIVKSQVSVCLGERHFGFQGGELGIWGFMTSQTPVGRAAAG